MRISDWSSDVCSSDLRQTCRTHTHRGASARMRPRAGVERRPGLVPPRRALDLDLARARDQERERQSCATHTDRGASRSEEHTSELQSLMRISYAVFCLKKKKTTNTSTAIHYQTHCTKQ